MRRLAILFCAGLGLLAGLSAQADEGLPDVAACPTRFEKLAGKARPTVIEKKEACEIVASSVRAAGRMDLPKVRPPLQKKISPERLKSLYTRMCVASFPAFPVANQIYMSIDHSSGLGAHYSNFVQGLNMLLAFHSCMARLSPSESRELLHMFLSMNMLGNAFFELGSTQKLDVFGLKSRSQTARNDTDWGDFAAGGAATLTYYLFVRSIESAYGVSLEEGCLK